MRGGNGSGTRGKKRKEGWPQRLEITSPSSRRSGAGACPRSGHVVGLEQLLGAVSPALPARLGAPGPRQPPPPTARLRPRPPLPLLPHLPPVRAPPALEAMAAEVEAVLQAAPGLSRVRAADNGGGDVGLAPAGTRSPLLPPTAAIATLRRPAAAALCVCRLMLPPPHHHHHTTPHTRTD